MNASQHFIAIIFLMIIGASIGSFLNVAIHRLPLGMSLLRPRSRCPRCKHEIASRDNIPILGWILLKGRCRTCSLPISARYPLVEAVTGCLVALMYCLDVTLSTTDPFERGAVALGAGLLINLVLISFSIVGTLIAYDRYHERAGALVIRENGTT